MQIFTQHKMIFFFFLAQINLMFNKFFPSKFNLHDKLAATAHSLCVFHSLLNKTFGMSFYRRARSFRTKRGVLLEQVIMSRQPAATD